MQEPPCSKASPALSGSQAGKLSIRALLLPHPTQLSQEALSGRIPPPHQGHGGGGNGRAGDPGKTQDLGPPQSSGFLSTRETPHWRREEGPGIKTALGTISPRLLNWSPGPLLMPFGRFPAVRDGRGCTPSRGVSEASSPQALQAPSHLQHLGGKQPVPVPRATQPSQVLSHKPHKHRLLHPSHHCPPPSNQPLSFSNAFFNWKSNHQR